MKTFSFFVLASLAILSGSAHATTTFNYLFTDGYPLNMSDDGSVITGNNASDYAAFRWTQATGRVELGQASVPVLGRTAGTACISADGTRIASTILSLDSTFVTAGQWNQAEGWQELLPPSPPDAGITDDEVASVWGMSDDGNVVVGLYWRSGFGRANAFRWTEATGAVSLGSSGRASRANGADHDGTVIAGWDEHPVQGHRRACAWLDGQLIVLGPSEMPGEGRCANRFGTVVGGTQLEPNSNLRQAAIWHRDGNGFSATQFLGALSGTSPSTGINVVNAITADAEMVVGYTSYNGDPFYTTGFVWSQGGGMVEVNQFLADRGILPDPSFTIASLTDVTPDGRLIVGWGRDVAAPFTVRAFMIELDTAVDVTLGPGDSSLRVVAQPNPHRNGTTLHFDMPRAESGVVSIYDSAGRLVRRLSDGPLAAGRNRVRWDGRDTAGARVAAGIYFTRLETGTTSVTSKIVVLR